MSKRKKKKPLGYRRTSRFKSESESISLNDQQYYDLIEKIDNHIALLERTPKITSIPDFKDFFKSKILETPSRIDFYSLNDETKTFICMIHISSKYIRYLKDIDIEIFADVIREYPLNPDDCGQYLINQINQSNILRELSKDPQHRAKKIKLISEKDFEYQGSFRHDSQDQFPKITHESNTLYRNLPNHFSYPLRIIFRRIVSIKHSFLLLLEQFYKIIGAIKHLNFDDYTYSQLHNSVLKENYESFRSIIEGWSGEIINELTDIVILFYPTLIYIETFTAEQTFEHISNDLNTKNSPLKFEFSFVGVILNILVNYILYKSIANHLDYSETEVLVDSYKQFYNPNSNNTLCLIDWSYYMNWINNGTEAIIDFVNNGDTCVEELKLETADNCVEELKLETADNCVEELKLETADNCVEELKLETANNGIYNEQTPIFYAPNPERPEGSSTNLKDDGNIEPPMEPDPKVEMPRHLYVPYSYDMLLKLAEGLVCGFSVESSGKHKPLVESKVHEGNNTKIKKLICLFSGVGINDESLRWPYNLKWNDKANSLKLLVYLLHYKGKLDNPLDAIDEGDDEGISDIIRTSFKGAPVWNIAGTAFGYRKDTLRATNKIPRRSNLKLMEELAKLWFECKKLDD